MTDARAEIAAALEGRRVEFRRLVEAADRDDLARPSSGTRWTNQELLFHMLLGYLIVRSLLPLVRLMSRLPVRVASAYAGLLDASTHPFNVINYWGSVLGSRIINSRRLVARFDAVIGKLQHQLAGEREVDLARSMPFPLRWDPFFKPAMTVEDVYRYGTQHFDFHRRQLTLG